MSDAPIAPIASTRKPGAPFLLMKGLDGKLVEVCPECESKPIKDGYKTCYRCHVNGFGVNWHGGGFMFGRHNFSARTNAEYVREHVGDVSDPNVKHVGSLDWKDI